MIGKRLKMLREELGLSQKELGAKLSVSSSTIGMYEVDKRTPDANMIERIADFFQVSADYLLGRTRNRNNSILEGKHNDNIIKIEVEGKDIDLTPEEIQKLIDKLSAVGFDVNKLIEK